MDFLEKNAQQSVMSKLKTLVLFLGGGKLVNTM